MGAAAGLGASRWTPPEAVESPDLEPGGRRGRVSPAGELVQIAVVSCASLAAALAEQPLPSER